MLYEALEGLSGLIRLCKDVTAATLPPTRNLLSGSPEPHGGVLRVSGIVKRDSAGAICDGHLRLPSAIAICDGHLRWPSAMAEELNADYFRIS